MMAEDDAEGATVLTYIKIYGKLLEPDEEIAAELGYYTDDHNRVFF